MMVTGFGFHVSFLHLPLKNFSHCVGLRKFVSVSFSAREPLNVSPVSEFAALLIQRVKALCVPRVCDGCKSALL